MSVDHDRIAGIIADIADNEIMPRFGNLTTEEVRTKENPNDLVTAVDEAVERSLKRALLSEFPGAGFVGEESAAADPSITAQIRSMDACWIVDPLDGTRNFVRGVDEFGTIVALVEHGKTTMGWIYAAPARKCAMAIAGGGAFWAGAALTPEPQQTEPPRGLRSLGWLSAEWRGKLKANLESYFETEPSHCSAYAYIKLAKGEVDFKISSRIHAWDHAAGALLVAEASGRTAYLDDHADYAPGESADRPLLTTAPGRAWPELAARLCG